MKFERTLKTDKSRTTFDLNTEWWKERTKKLPKSQIYLEYVDSTESTVEFGTLKAFAYALCPWLLDRDLKRNRRPKKEDNAQT